MKKCPFCGEEIQEAAVKCKHCKEWLSKTGEPSQQPVNIPAQDERSVSSSNSHQKAAITVYAGFWRRFVAAIIDTIILAIGVVLIGGITGGIIGYALGASEGMVAIVYIICIVLNWLYFTLLESSSKQATLGKMAIGIIVTDINGSRISFGKANGRYWGKIVSGIILLIGYVMAGFTQKKQALHDIMAGCLVIRDRETWCSRHYKGLSALLISIPIIGIIAAICIPAYLGVQERARNAQNEQASAPAPAPKTTEELIKSIEGDDPFKPVTSNKTPEEKFIDTLTELVPDWQTIKNEPGFAQYLSEYDQQLGRIRHTAAKEAQDRLDAYTIAQFYNDYKKIKQK